MSRELFNFIWVPGRKANTIRIGASTDRVDCFVHKPKEAVIMYPTLFTPAVYVEGRAKQPVVELLIASKEELTPADVNVHLKISPGLDPEKAYDPRPLFASLAGEPIKLESTSANEHGILQTESRFSGILAKQIEDLYKPYKHKYKVEVSDGAIRRDSAALTEKLSTRMTVGGLENAIVGQEPQDISIAAFLENAGAQGGNPGPVPGRRRYGFKVKDDGTLDLARANPDEPVQSYHPLFVWSEKLAIANFGHVSDIHINSRLTLLQRSPACVVEDPDHRSPEVGTRLADTNTSFASVLGKMRQDPTVHALAVGGDLIDHIRNTYNRDLFDPAHPASVNAIWKAVDLQEGGLHDRYPAGVDYLIFYSMMVDFCRRSSKPIFGISGNHDAYEEPFGISPRLGPKRGNAGIPADLNLTFYEALLCFGPTWATLVKSLNFNDDWWTWFYRVFGGFNDFVVRLPDQGIVGLGWGGAETIISGSQGYAHLPRSDDAVTHAQLALFKLALPPHVVLFTHFTILSFDDPIPMLDANRAKRTGTLSEELDSFNMGTFETNRPRMIELLRSSALQLVISGHSHRRATYEINPGETEKLIAVGEQVEPIKVLSITMHDTKTVGSAVGKFRAPVIVVSDSAGPMPRLNIADEFGQWGSDLAAGTLATFKEDGDLSSLGVVAADGARPRVAVALDYLDITLKPSHVLAGAISTEEFSPGQEAAAVAAAEPSEFYKVKLPLVSEFLLRTKTTVRGFTLHGAVAKDANQSGLEWLRIELRRLDASGQQWVVPAAKTREFQRWANSAVESIVALVFESSDPFLSSHYNWEDPWYFEVVTEPEVISHGRAGTGMRYISQRPTRKASGSAAWNDSFREVPDFDWRRENLKDKYSG